MRVDGWGVEGRQHGDQAGCLKNAVRCLCAPISRDSIPRGVSGAGNFALWVHPQRTDALDRVQSGRGGATQLISHRVFSTSLCRSQFPQKSINLLFTSVKVKDTLTDLWWSRLLQNFFKNVLCEIKGDLPARGASSSSSDPYFRRGFRVVPSSSSVTRLSQSADSSFSTRSAILCRSRRKHFKTV